MHNVLGSDAYICYTACVEAMSCVWISTASDCLLMVVSICAYSIPTEIETN